MAKSAEDIIAGAKPAERVVSLCLRTDLQAEHEQLNDQLDKARKQVRTSLADGGEATGLAERIRELEDEMAENVVEFRLRAMGRTRWNMLERAHPPRRKDDGDVLESDAFLGLNVETFFPVVVPLSVAEPKLSPEYWRRLIGDSDEERARLEAAGEQVEDGLLTDRQFNQLANAVIVLNRGVLDIPFSRAASAILDSEPESN